MTERYVIAGAGGHGRVILDILASRKIDVAGFIDDDPTKKGQRVDGAEILGGWDAISRLGQVLVVPGIGNNRLRAKLGDKARALGLRLGRAVHASAVVSPRAELGEGVVIMPGAVVNAGARLAEGAVVNTGATVDHDCVLERYSQVWPGAHLAGTVRLGELSYVGTGASVIQNINIGSNVVIGAGAAVVSNIEDDVVAVGVPARPCRRNTNG